MQNSALFFLLVVFAGASRSLAGDQTPIAFPKDSGVIDVREKYHARGDGVTDDADAIQTAITENLDAVRTLYFPPGKYLVSHKLSYGTSLEHAKFLILQGAGRDLTTIKLKDRAPGFGDGGKPEFLLTQFEGDSTGQAFGNCVFDLTLDVGAGNPGAIGLQAVANNQGAVENVRIKSSDPAGAGYVGLDLSRHETGPSLIKNVEIDGFELGVATKDDADFSLVFEHLVINNPSRAGIRTISQVMTIRDLKYAGPGPAIEINGGWGMITLIDSTLKQTDPSAAKKSAIFNQGFVLLRNDKIEGFTELVHGNAAANEMLKKSGGKIVEFCSEQPKSLFGDHNLATLDLPIEETPVAPWDAPDKWAGIDDYSWGINSKDLQDLIDKAAAAGKTTVYLSAGLQRGAITLDDTVKIHGSVRRILGNFAPITASQKMIDAKTPYFRVEKDAAKTVWFDRIFVPQNWSNVFIEHDGPGTVVIRNSEISALSYTAKPGAGKLFVEDVTALQFHFVPHQKVWMRQINPEGNATMLDNDGGDLWVLGMKTEGYGTLIKTTHGGRSELLGGLMYPSWGPPPFPGMNQFVPAFIVNDASVSITMGITSWSTDHRYPISVEETRNGVTRQIKHDDYTGNRGYGGSIPLFVAKK